AAGLGHERFRQNFQRRQAPQADVARRVDLSHPTRPEGVQDLIGAEASAGKQSHQVPSDYGRRMRYATPAPNHRLSLGMRPPNKGRYATMKQLSRREFGGLAVATIVFGTGR